MAPTGSGLRIVSYNIRAGIGPGDFPAAWWRVGDRGRLEGIGRFLRGLEPDVVALQEVGLTTIDGEVLDQAAELGRLTDLPGVRYGAVGHFPIIDPDSRETIGACFWGNAILSRLSILDSRTVGLPVAGDDDLVEPADSTLELAGVRYADAPTGVREPRCLLEATVDLGERPVAVVSIHLTHRGSGQRETQARRVAAWLAAATTPVVLAGDLNAPLATPGLAPLRSGLVDAFAASGIALDDPARISCGRIAIDHVLVRGLRPRSCRVAREAGDLSDHWPVVAELTL